MTEQSKNHAVVLIVLVAALVLFGIYSPVNFIPGITGQTALMPQKTSAIIGYILVLAIAIALAVLIAPAFRRRR